MGENKILGIIPARKESKRLKRKNTTMLAGKPLFRWVTDTLVAICDKVVVTTDDNDLKEMCNNINVDIVNRPPELATDTATSIDVALHIIKLYPEYDFVFYAEPTMPNIRLEDLERMVRYLRNDNLPAIATANPYTLKFTGTVIFIQREVLLKQKTLFPFGMGIYFVEGMCAMDIDTWHDLVITDSFLRGRIYK